MPKVSFNTTKRARYGRLVAYAPHITAGLIFIITPVFMTGYLQSLMTKILIYGIFAMSLNLLWGYAGLFSLGHAAYFGVAGYTVGILIVKIGIGSFWLTTPVGILTATLCAAIFGIIALRVSGVYFLLVTLAIGQLLYNVALKWRVVTGGSNGLVGITYPDFGVSWLTLNTASYYYFVFTVFVISIFLLYRIVNSRFGYALQGIRDNEPRMQSLGYNTWLHKYIAFVVAGLFAGVAGVLLGPYSGILVPGHVGILTSVLAMLMIILGSDRAFFGPVVGAIIIILLEHYSSLYMPERWPLILGSVFVISVIFLRGGITIHLSRSWKRILATWKL